MSTMQEMISSTLMDIGINPALRGYGYLKIAIEMAYYNREYMYAMTKRMYPTIAEKVGSTPTRVERGIRHAIERAFSNMSVETNERYFKNVTSISSGKVTNSTFVAVVVEHIANSIQSDGIMREEEHHNASNGLV